MKITPTNNVAQKQQNFGAYMWTNNKEASTLYKIYKDESPKTQLFRNAFNKLLKGQETNPHFNVTIEQEKGNFNFITRYLGDEKPVCKGFLFKIQDFCNYQSIKRINWLNKFVKDMADTEKCLNKTNENMVEVKKLGNKLCRGTFTKGDIYSFSKS
jgi:hypothetical protein